MAEDVSGKKKKVASSTSIHAAKIPVNAEVKKYTMDRLRELGNLKASDVHRSLRSGKGVVCKDNEKAVKLIDELLLHIPEFIPDFPTTEDERKSMYEFKDAWLAHVKSLRKQLLHRSQPVYLYTKVDEELKKLGSDMSCADIHLEWYLSRFGGDAMQPDKIAAALVKYSATNWKKVRPLAKNDKYSIRLSSDTEKERRNAVKNIQWLYEINSEIVSSSIIEKIENDLKVLKEFNDKCNADPLSYDYKENYEAFKLRLQTTPSSFTLSEQHQDRQESSSEQKEIISSSSNESSTPPVQVDVHTTPLPSKQEPKDEEYEVAKLNFNAGYHLDENAQKVLIRHGHCPHCGNDMKVVPAGTSQSGKSYPAFVGCSARCGYNAGGTIQEPYIYDRYKTPDFIPQPNRITL